MVASNLGGEGIPIGPAEADTVLIVNSDAVLPFATSFRALPTGSEMQGQAPEHGSCHGAHIFCCRPVGANCLKSPRWNV